MNVTSDLHIHSTLSECCRDANHSLQFLPAHLQAMGLKKIAFTDHFWLNPDVKPSSWYAAQSPQNVIDLANKIQSMEFPIRVLAGCETDMCSPDRIGITQKACEHFDLVLLASDHFHMRGFVEQPESPTPEALAPHMMKFFRAAAASNLADILVHPLIPLSYQNIYDKTVDLISDQEFLDAFDLAARNNAAIEINLSVLRSCVKTQNFEMDTLLRVFSLAKKANCRFTFGSDSHRLEDFQNFDLFTDFAEKLELTQEDLHPLALMETVP